MGSRSHALFEILLQDLRANLNDPVAFERIAKGEEWPGMSYKEMACLSIRKSLLKKLRSGMTDKTKAIALDKFLAANSRCAEWQLPATRSWADDVLLGEFRLLIDQFWLKYRSGTWAGLVDHHYDILKQGGVGPGSSYEADGQDFYTKFFSSKLVGTSSNLYYWYRRYISCFPSWKEAECLRSLDRGEFECTDRNRLDFVPKNDSESRSICVEPALNMYYQLGFGNILRERLRDLWGINLEVQQFLNRDLARKGSLDGSFATIDLTSASDSISTKMLRWALPPDFMRWLEALRCPKSRLPDGRLVDLEMISTMGNGFTFPLQSVIFTAAVLACFRVDGLAPVYPNSRSSGNFGVNGDDLVVPTVIYRKVRRLLQLLGFQLNEAKTFAEGSFRESCGGDYFQGRNLRGVYVKDLMKPQDIYPVINALNLFSARTGVVLSRSVQFLTKYVRFQLVPRWANDDSGIRSFTELITRKDARTDHNGSWIYQSWESAVPPRIQISEYGLRSPKAYRVRSFNPPGLEVALLQGSVNACTISLKPREVLYRWKSRTAANWDYASTYVGALSQLSPSSVTVHSFQEWLPGSRWKTAVYLNLFG